MITIETSLNPILISIVGAICIVRLPSITSGVHYCMFYFVVLDAIEAIVTHSERSMELLKRKRLCKNVLFEYLENRNVSVKTTGTKTIFIEKILEYWRMSNSWNPFPLSVPRSWKPVAASVPRSQKPSPSLSSPSPPPSAWSSPSSRSQNNYATPTQFHQVRHSSLLGYIVDLTLSRVFRICES